MSVEVGEGPAGVPVRPFRTGVATWSPRGAGRCERDGTERDNWATRDLAGRLRRSTTSSSLWSRPEEALDRAVALGCDAIGVPVEWARIEPADGVVDEDVLSRYQGILDGCSDRGLEPVLTLYHGTHPSWLGEELWLTPGGPDRFAAHVSTVARHLADRCRCWVTVRDPTAVAVDGWLRGVAPPGRVAAVADAFTVLDNLLAGHVLAYRALHEVRPDALVAFGVADSPLYEVSGLPLDLLCASAVGVGRRGLDAWIDERRARHDGSVPASPVARWWRLAAATVSPYGSGPRPARPGGRAIASRLRRSGARRAVEVVFDPDHPDDGLPLDAVALHEAGGSAVAVPAAPRDPMERLSVTLGRTVLAGTAVDRGVDRRWAEVQALVPGLPGWCYEGAPRLGDDRPGAAWEARFVWLDPVGNRPGPGPAPARGATRPQVTSRDVVVK